MSSNQNSNHTSDLNYNPNDNYSYQNNNQYNIETNSPQQQASKNVQYNDYQIIDTTQSHASTTQTPLATNNNSYYQPNQKPSQVLPHTKLPNQNTPSNNTSNSTEDEVDEEDRNQDDGDMDNEDDIYNEDIDDAYSRYEREQEDTLNMMNECIQFQNNPTTSYPSNAHIVYLNPEAAEFRPSGRSFNNTSSSPFTTDVLSNLNVSTTADDAPSISASKKQ